SRTDVLTYTVSSSNPAVATAALTTTLQGQLAVTPVQIGTATITVTATDLFGNTASTTFKVTVKGTNTAPVRSEERRVGKEWPRDWSSDVCSSDLAARTC